MLKKLFRAIMNYGIMLGAIVLLLAPHRVGAEATHQSEFNGNFSAQTLFPLYTNFSGTLQTIMVTSCIDRGLINFFVGEAGLFAVNQGTCRGTTVVLEAGQSLQIQPLSGELIARFQISTSLVLQPQPTEK
jgi:hypothetical protein